LIRRVSQVGVLKEHGRLEARASDVAAMGPLKKDGPSVDIEMHAFLTTTPNSLVATIKRRWRRHRE
jgi:hypothetical protein